MDYEPTSFYAEFYSGAGGEVDECLLMLRLFGDELEPELITELLGVEPTKAYRKGDSRNGNASVRERTGLWLLEWHRSKECANSQLRRVLAVLPQDLTIWQDLSGRFSAEFKIHLFLARWCRGTVLSSDVIKMISDRGLGLNIDIYSRRPDA